MVIRRQSGFTLLEVLVTVVLVMLVLLLLARGVELVSKSVIEGQRKLDLQRQVETARRVLRQDMEAVVGAERWPVWYGGAQETEPVLSFLRYRDGSAGNTETDWVQYWMRPHPEVDRLFQWVRYSRPADDRENFYGEVDPTKPWSESDDEVILDELVRMDLRVWTDSGEVTPGGYLNVEEPRVLDVRWAVTGPPLPVVNTPSSRFLERVEQERGEWVEFRCAVGVSP